MDRSDELEEAGRSDWPEGDLPPLELADLPEPPQSAWRLIGPGIVAAGVGLGSSEFILFPYIATQVGMSFLWAAILAVILQYFLIMEVERYALATGETILTGFRRLGRLWGPLFCIMAVLTAAWPGWATSAGTLFTYLFGGTASTYSLIIMVLIGIILTLSPVAYRSLERAEFLKVIAVGLLFVGTIALAIPADAIARAPGSFLDFKLPVAELGLPMVLGALAFAGTGGAGILCQSNWIRDKGFAMGARAPRIVSPIFGHPVAASGTGWRFPLTPEMLSRWRSWWRFAVIEQLSTFVTVCVLTLIFTSLLAYALFYGEPNLPSDINFLKVQGNLLAERAGTWLSALFWLVGALALFATALGVVDLTSRLIADVMRTSYFRHVSESRLYAVTVWTLLALGIAIIALAATPPVTLLIISGSMSGIMMALFSPLLIIVNRRLPTPLRPGALQSSVVAVGTIAFAALSLATAADLLGWI